MKRRYILPSVEDKPVKCNSCGKRYNNRQTLLVNGKEVCGRCFFFTK